MASNLIIANPWIKDDFLVSATNYDIVNMATSPGQDIGGQSYQSYGSSWVKTRDTVYEDALLELTTNNMLTLAGNYVSGSCYGAYNLYYMINGVAQKEISGAKFSGNGGSINFSAQTGGAYVTKSVPCRKSRLTMISGFLWTRGEPLPREPLPMISMRP